MRYGDGVYGNVLDEINLYSPLHDHGEGCFKMKVLKRGEVEPGKQKGGIAESGPHPG